MLRYIKSATLLFLGGVFLYSAYAKMVPIEFFENQIADLGWFSWRMSEIIARLIIGMEMGLGMLLIFHINLRRFTIPLALGMLMVFNGFLIYQWIQYGNQPNCGCFGIKVEFSTSESLIKNVILMLMLVGVYFLSPSWQLSVSSWIPWTVLLMMEVIAFLMVKPLPPKNILDRKKIGKKIDYNYLYNDPVATPPMQEDVYTGKHIVTFADLGCKHCELAVTKMAIMKKRNSELPFYIVFHGIEDSIGSFLNKTKGDQLPYIFEPNVVHFIKMAGGAGFPSINWIHDTVLEYKTLHYELVQEDIETWLQSQ